MRRAKREVPASVRLLGIVLVALAVAGPTTGAAQLDARTDAALDLPAMALTPADLAAAGLDDYVVGVGNLTPMAVEAAWLARALDLAEDDLVDAFEVAGVDQVYTHFLDRLDDPEDPNSEIVGSVVSYAYVGEDEAGAEALFELMAQGAAETAQFVVDAEIVGDASSLTLHQGRDVYFAAEAVRLALHIHSGRDVAGAVVIDYAGDIPDADDALALGERLLERIAAVRDGESPGLAPLTLQLVPEHGIGLPGPYYLQVDGEALPVGTLHSGLGSAFETVLDDEARAALYDEIGTVDVYFHEQRLRGGEEGGTDVNFYHALLLRFTDEEAAEAYVASLPERFADWAGVEDVEELDEAPTDGDEAVAFTYNYKSDGERYFFYSTYIRVGEVVALVEVLGPEAHEAGAEAVAEAQAECLADGGCPEPLEAPADLRDD